MAKTNAPFAIFGHIGPKLEAVLAYWRALRRGAADMPFADDLSIPSVEHLGSEVFLLDVFVRPERFRLSEAAVGLTMQDEDRILGKFIDEVNLPTPFELLRAQASATVEHMRPTLYTHEPVKASDQAYDRLLLPAWEGGEVRLLLGAVERR
jgi:hypothetical protein